jgi:Transglycosylase SLT domain
MACRAVTTGGGGVRLTRALVLGAAATAVALSGGSGPSSTPITEDRADDRVVRQRTSVTVPEQVSFDDLPPTLSRAALATRAPGPVVPRPRPATATSTTRPAGSWPAAGSAQAVLARAYRDATEATSPSCHLEEAHLAAVGQVESGSVGGRTIGADHRVSPAIYGPLLDGGPFAVIRDSDGGRHDGDSAWDRAMGPLQFLPGTWSWAGRDGDGDGRRDPQNVFDAALATAGYLCHGGRDLSRDADLRSAVLSYNQSNDYLAAVLEWVAHFDRHGLGALDDVAFRVGSGGRASDLQAAPEVVKPPAQRPTRAASPSPTPSTRPSATSRPQSTGTPTGTATVTVTGTATVPPTPDPTTTTAVDPPSPPAETTTTAVPPPTTTGSG